MAKDYNRKTGTVNCFNCGNSVEAERKPYVEMYQVICSDCGKTYWLDESQMYVEVEQHNSISED